MERSQKSRWSAPGSRLRPSSFPKDQPDLLRQANVQRDHSEVFIDEKELAEHLVLKTGMIIRIVPGPKSVADRESWRETIGMFKDDPAFEEMMQAVWAAREAEREARHEDH
jgi:hypothetical protein